MEGSTHVRESIILYFSIAASKSHDFYVHATSI